MRAPASGCGEHLRDARTCRRSYNPDEGFIASANNKPQDGDAAVGFFFSPDDRVRRMAALIERAGTVDVDQVKAMQRDVHVDSSAALNEVLVRKLRQTGIADETRPERRGGVFELMAGWDGEYRADAQAPVAFELFRFHFTQAVLRGGVRRRRTGPRSPASAASRRC